MGRSTDDFQYGRGHVRVIGSAEASQRAADWYAEGENRANVQAGTGSQNWREDFNRSSAERSQNRREKTKTTMSRLEARNRAKRKNK